MPRPATFGAWMELRPGRGRQPDPRFYAECLEEAERAERPGLAAVWGSGHHAVEDGCLPQQLPFLAAVAARTSRIRIGTGVLLLPLARPRDVAEQAGGGGLVRGGGPPGGRGAPPRRAARRSPQPRGPPIYLGGMAEPALERVARLADGWFALAHYRYDRTPMAYPALRAGLERAGRPVDGFPIVVGVHLRVSDDPERTWETELAPAVAYQLDRYNDWGTDRDQPRPGPIEPGRLKRSAVLCDTAEGIVRSLSELRERLPFTHVALWTRPPGVTHEAACANLERVAAEVAPAFADGPPPAWRAKA